MEKHAHTFFSNQTYEHFHFQMKVAYFIINYKEKEKYS